MLRIRRRQGHRRLKVGVVNDGEMGLKREKEGKKGNVLYRGRSSIQIDDKEILKLVNLYLLQEQDHTFVHL
jgi:hypothetical protein